MKKKKIVSLLLSLALLSAAFVPGTVAGAAENSSGMVISKTATAKEDGSYTIQLEAYATGSKVITETKKDIPTDIVLVLDQSGSMADAIGTVTFEAYEDEKSGYWSDYNTRNRDHYENRHNGGNGNLYYPLGDGVYASVSVTVQSTYRYTQITSGRNNSKRYSYTSYWENQNNLYAKVGGEYQKVTVTREETGGNLFGTTYTYTYRLPDGRVIAASEGDTGVPVFSDIEGNVLYLLTEDDSTKVYTYTYTDANGETQTIGTSAGAETTFGTTLYKRVVNANGGDSRLEALKTAVTNFSSSVAKKAAGEDGILGNEDDMDHRIAVVGFASESGHGNNTELLSVSGTNSGSVGIAYNSITDQNLKDVMQDMSTAAGQAMVTNSINALDAEGATQVDLGMDMAKRILDANPVSAGETRNRVVIVFTDGSPTSFSDFDASVANSAIGKSSEIKNSGAQVYSVGVFSGADATNAGDSNGADTEKCNWFMQNVSSNNGTPQNPSYYLSAADAATLNNIFQQISDQIESGGASTTLSSETVIKDIISPAFTLPEGADAEDITLETYSCTGKSGDSYTWNKNDDAMGASAAVDGDSVSVTGFDFAANYVGTVTENGNVTYRGDKLVITFDASPKSGFLGGNNVYTNSGAGIYENSSASDPVLEFDRPQVNVSIGDVTVDAESKDVYLMQDVTGEQLRSGTVVKVGDVSLDLAKENYGLETWQTEYVNITVEIKDKDGKMISSGWNDLTDDQSYTVSVQVSPKFDGTNASGAVAEKKSGSDEAEIHVYKPELTFKDCTGYYGDGVPADFSNNVTSVVWKYGDTKANSEKMGIAPVLSITYTPDAAKTADWKINSKQDIAVNTAVKIGETDITDETGFLHTSCEGECGWNETTLDGTPAFLLHVNTCQLTITKNGGASDEPYVFNVLKDGVKYSEVTIVGNGEKTIYELPVGNYTIQEDEGWSWRYAPGYGQNSAGVSLTAGNPQGALTCTNTLNGSIYWLNGYSDVVTNIFGENS